MNLQTVPLKNRLFPNVVMTATKPGIKLEYLIFDYLISPEMWTMTGEKVTLVVKEIHDNVQLKNMQNNY